MSIARVFGLVTVVLVLATAAACATPWTTYLTATGTTGRIQVDTSAAQVGSLWHWVYDVTPIDGADEIRGFTITLGSDIVNLVSNVAGPSADTGSGWASVPDWVGKKGSTRVYWSFDVINGDDTNKLNTNETFRFEFDHPMGPVADYSASAQDTYGWGGVVKGPVVPEPMSMFSLLAGLTGVAGLKLRRR